jgi:enterobactin synthetase component D
VLTAVSVFAPTTDGDATTPLIVPPQARQYSVEFGASHPALPAFANAIPCPPDLAAAPPPRIRQYRAGRLCARRALQELAGTTAGPVRVRGPGGVPVWPSGIVGSITHTDDFASAAVARASDVAGLGIDAEPIMSDEIARGIAPGIAWACELLEGRRAGLTRLEALTVVFSAKEAVFKCLYPRVGRFFDSHDVRIIAVDSDSGTFVARVVKSLSGELPAGTTVAGHFAIACGRVHSGAVLRTLPHVAR